MEEAQVPNLSPTTLGILCLSSALLIWGFLETNSPGLEVSGVVPQLREGWTKVLPALLGD